MYRLIFIEVRIRILNHSRHLFTLQTMLGTVDQTDCRIFLPPGEVIVPDCDAAAVLGIDDRETGEPGLKPAGIDEPVPADDERIDRESINQLVVERLHEVSFETDTSVIRSPPRSGHHAK